MIKLYLKTVLIAIILISLSIGLYFVGYNTLYEPKAVEIDLLLSKAALEEVQDTLLATPESEWNNVLDQYSKQRKIALEKISDLKVIDSQRQALLEHQTIFTGQSWLFLNYFVMGSTVYQRVGNTDYALVMIHGIRPEDSLYAATQFLVSQITEKLKSKNLETLTAQYGFPIHLLSNDDRSLTSDMLNQLNETGIAFTTQENGYVINTLYFTMAENNQILVLGPINYTPVASRMTDIQDNYFYSFVILAVFIVFFLTWLFSRNVRKIFYVTQQYGRGKFDNNIPVSKTSVLYGVYQNILRMGQSLKRLLESQRNMTRFVAHEIRTPLYSMQLATESLKDTNLPKEAEKYIKGLQEDINELNELVAQFLLYSQTSNHEVQLQLKEINLNSWLEELLKRYQSNKINIAFQCKDRINAKIDERLFKHAINNLMTNALKFAHKSIIISVGESAHGLTITIEDDGPGVSPSDQEKIFEPFSTLSVSDSSTKHIGLGLSIAKSIISLHKGSLSVAKSGQGGCKFTILII